MLREADGPHLSADGRSLRTSSSTPLYFDDIDQVGCLNRNRTTEQNLGWRARSLSGRPTFPQPHFIRNQRVAGTPGGLAAGVAAIDRRQESLRSEMIEQGRTIKNKHDLRSIAASLPLPVHTFLVGPEEDMAVEQGVPIGGLQAVLERRGESGRRHRPLVADEYALGQTNTVRSVVAEQPCSPRLRNRSDGR